MFLKRLLFRNFRNYAQAEIVFSPFVNLILGDNGQGKTNLLEAIHLISTGRSFRTNSLSDLIRFDQSFFFIEAEFEKEGISQSIKVYYDETTRKVQYNQTVHTSLTSLLGILPSVLLSPDDITLVSGTPAERRRFIDLHCAQMDPLYVHHLGRYFRAMKQRNALLKTKSESAIQSWEQMMAQSANYLVKKRRQIISHLASPSSQWMQILSHQRDSIHIQYQSSLNAPSEGVDCTTLFQQLWQKMRQKEMQIGSTIAGPHRDDLTIELAGNLAKVFSSEGQKRSCISALRFAQWEQMAATLSYPPLLGIDDFGIQLDEERKSQLKNHLGKFSQVFLTSPLFLDKHFKDTPSINILHIKQGSIIN